MGLAPQGHGPVRHEVPTERLWFDFQLGGLSWAPELSPWLALLTQGTVCMGPQGSHSHMLSAGRCYSMLGLTPLPLSFSHSLCWLTLPYITNIIIYYMIPFTFRVKVIKEKIWIQRHNIFFKVRCSEKRGDHVLHQLYSWFSDILVYFFICINVLCKGLKYWMLTTCNRT